MLYLLLILLLSAQAQKYEGYRTGFICKHKHLNKFTYADRNRECPMKYRLLAEGDKITGPIIRWDQLEVEMVKEYSSPPSDGGGSSCGCGRN